MLYYNLKVCCFFNFKIDACFFGWNLEGFFWKTELAWKCPVICATFSGKSSPLSLKVRQMSQVFGVTLWSDISESYSKSSVLTSSFPSTSLFLLQFWHLHRSVQVSLLFQHLHRYGFTHAQTQFDQCWTVICHNWNQRTINILPTMVNWQ